MNNVLLRGEVHLSPFHTLVTAAERAHHLSVYTLLWTSYLMWRTSWSGMLRNQCAVPVERTQFGVQRTGASCTLIGTYKLCTQPRSELANARLPCWRQPCQNQQLVVRMPFKARREYLLGSTSAPCPLYEGLI